MSLSSASPTSKRPLIEQAKMVLDRNWRNGYTVPSARLYPFQWNWDSGFIALGLTYHRPERAIEEMRSMFKGQWRNGLLPHINFHEPNSNYFPGPEIWKIEKAADRPAGFLTSGITQPPVFAFIVERISALPLGRTPEWAAFVREIYPRILSFHRYLYTRRDPHGEGLVYIQHNWESGTDNSPAWDSILDAMDVSGMRDVSKLRRDTRNAEAAHRPTNANYQRYIHLIDEFARCGYRDDAIAAESPFLVQDVLFNSLLIKSNFSLLTLAQKLGEPTAEIEAWNAKAIHAVNDKLWDERQGFYFAYDLRHGRRIPVKTSSGFLPLFAGLASSQQAGRLGEHLVKSFTRGAGWRLCASTAVDEPTFDPVKYWRGPVWINLNWMIYHGLRRYRLDDLAQRLKSDTLELLGSAGLFEYFDPRPPEESTVRGLGTDQFSWTAALTLDLLSNPVTL
jgi:glycogen debranching enzyme